MNVLVDNNSTKTVKKIKLIGKSRLNIDFGRGGRSCLNRFLGLGIRTAYLKRVPLDLPRFTGGQKRSSAYAATNVAISNNRPTDDVSNH